MPLSLPLALDAFSRAPWPRDVPRVEALGNDLPADDSTQTEAPLIVTFLESLVSRLGEVDRWTCPSLARQVDLARRSDSGVHLILNAVDPLATVGAVALAMETSSIAPAVEAMRGELPIERITLALVDDVPRWIRRTLSHSIKPLDGARLRLVPSQYPMGEARLLASEVRHGPLVPLVLDWAAVIDVASLASTRRLEDRVMFELIDLPARSSRLLTAPRGWTLRQAATTAVLSSGFDLRAGPVLRDNASSLERPLGVGERVATQLPIAPMLDAVDCIRCGWCAEVCPVSLSPVELVESLHRPRPDALARLEARRCIDCGLCTYVCPSRLSLREGIQSGRGST